MASLVPRTIIIAVGKGAFTPRKLLADYDPAIENNKLFYYVSKNKLFENQVVAIAGGGDTAVDTALSLLPVAKEIHLIHRHESFRGLESSVTHLQQHPNVTMHTPYLIKKIDDGDQLTLHLDKMRSDEQTTLKVDKVILVMVLSLIIAFCGSGTLNYNIMKSLLTKKWKLISLVFMPLVMQLPTLARCN